MRNFMHTKGAIQAVVGQNLRRIIEEERREMERRLELEAVKKLLRDETLTRELNLHRQHELMSLRD